MNGVKVTSRPRRKLFFTFGAAAADLRAFMEDMNWWGVLAMPIGVVLCFGPVIVAWALAERRDATEEHKHRR